MSFLRSLLLVGCVDPCVHDLVESRVIFRIHGNNGWSEDELVLRIITSTAANKHCGENEKNDKIEQ